MITAIHKSLFLERQSHIQDVPNATTDNNVKLTRDQTSQRDSSFFKDLLIPQASPSETDQSVLLLQFCPPSSFDTRTSETCDHKQEVVRDKWL